MSTFGVWSVKGRGIAGSRNHGQSSEGKIAMGWETYAIRIFAAALAGGVVGFDRQRRDRTAGIRTHMLVAVGSSVLILSAITYTEQLESELQTDAKLQEIDVTRVIQGVIGGIGFLGAGAILRERGDDGRVRGLTTAASIWASAALGMVCGFGQTALALCGTAAVAIVVAVLRPIWHDSDD